jgi:hypothetical protein
MQRAPESVMSAKIVAVLRMIKRDLVERRIGFSPGRGARNSYAGFKVMNNFAFQQHRT